MPSFTIPIIIDSEGRTRKSRTMPEAYSVTNRLSIKRGDTANFALQFLVRNSTSTFRLPVNSIIKIAFKVKGRYDTDEKYVCFGATRSRPSDDSLPYNITVPIKGKKLNALFRVDGNADNDVEYVDLMFEVSWSEDGSTWNSTTQPVEVRVFNDIIRQGTLVDPLPPALQIPQVFSTSIKLNEGGTRNVFVNLKELFDLKDGDVAHVKVIASISRRLEQSGLPYPDYGLSCLGYGEWLVNVDMTDPELTSGVPGVVQTATGGNANPSLGTDHLDLTGGGHPEPDARFNQSVCFGIEFSHTGPSTYPHLSLIGCLRIELISVAHFEDGEEEAASSSSSDSGSGSDSDSDSSDSDSGSDGASSGSLSLSLSS